jgi:hypothetical protein
VVHRTAVMNRRNANGAISRPTRSTASSTRRAVRAKGSALESAATEQPVEGQGPCSPHDHQAEQHRREEVFGQQLVGELDHQREDEERDRRDPGEEADSDRAQRSASCRRQSKLRGRLTSRRNAPPTCDARARLAGVPCHWPLAGSSSSRRRQNRAPWRRRSRRQGATIPGETKRTECPSAGVLPPKVIRTQHEMSMD